MIYLNYPYRCRHCGTVYVILPGYGFNSYLPVEVITGSERYDREFDRYKHKSHLLGCKGLQEQWEDVKRMIKKQRVGYK